MFARTFFLSTLSVVIFSSQSVYSQFCFPAKKLYAYSQPVTRGIESRDDLKPKPAGNFYLYIESKRSGITLGNLWIMGEGYNGQLKEVTSPVILEGTVSNSILMKGDAPVELVPITNKKVYQVVLIAREQGKPAAPLPVKYSAKAVVMELHYKNRKKIVTAYEMKPLKLEARY
ncbi:MAG: hypothetical protein WKF89_00275 [Chitinophagaceae bacterium]